jgi:hypothetical protein
MVRNELLKLIGGRAGRGGGTAVEAAGVLSGIGAAGFAGSFRISPRGVAAPEDGVETEAFFTRAEGFGLGGYLLSISSSTALPALIPLPSKTTRILSSICRLILPPSQTLHTCMATS